MKQLELSDFPSGAIERIGCEFRAGVVVGECTEFRGGKIVKKTPILWPALDRAYKRAAKAARRKR